MRSLGFKSPRDYANDYGAGKRAEDSDIAWANEWVKRGCYSDPEFFSEQHPTACDRKKTKSIKANARELEKVMLKYERQKTLPEPKQRMTRKELVATDSNAQLISNLIDECAANDPLLDLEAKLKARLAVYSFHKRLPPHMQRTQEEIIQFDPEANRLATLIKQLKSAL